MKPTPGSRRSTAIDGPRIDDSFSLVMSDPAIGWSVGTFRKVIKVWDISSDIEWNENTVLTTTASGWTFATRDVGLETLFRQQWLIFKGSLEYQNQPLTDQLKRCPGACVIFSDTITITITSGGYPLRKTVAAKFSYPDIPEDLVTS